MSPNGGNEPIGEPIPDGGADSKPAEQVTLPWVEQAERELRDVAATATIALLLTLTLLSIYRFLRGAPGNHMGAAAFGLVLAALGAFIWYGPMGGVGARASVDERGLWIRHNGWSIGPDAKYRIELSPVKHLPAEQIGDINLVVGQRRRELWRKSISLVVGRRRIGWTRTNLDRDTQVAVMIEQVGDELRRPWWLIKCHQPDELVAALELARERAGS